MKSAVQLKTAILPSLVTLALVFFVLLPRAQAVTPPPDGGYPGGNTAEGQSALLSLSGGTYNTAVGFLSLTSNTEGSFNTGVGAGTLLSNVGTQGTTDGTQNTAIGAGALLSNTTGAGNTANGTFALFSNTTGTFNTANGDNAFLHNTTGSENTAMGAGALFYNTTGAGNTALGFNAGLNVTTANNVICVGAIGANVSNSCYINNIYGNIQPVVGFDPDFVTITSSGRLGRANISSRRYKHDIKPMDKASEVLFAFKPVSFRYNKEYDATQTLAFGLIAEDVSQVDPDLVGRNNKGQPESVRYDQVNAMLLNEFLKEHRKVENLEVTVAQQRKDFQTATTQQQKEFESKLAQQQKQIEALTIGLQKVNAQLETSKPAPQVVANDQWR